MAQVVEHLLSKHEALKPEFKPPVLKKKQQFFVIFFVVVVLLENPELNSVLLAIINIPYFPKAMG
jgi:hypothetical protein